jgi:hypothetical protein
VPPAAKPKPPAPAEKKSEKKKFLAIGALLTSTPFLIAIAIHALLLIGGGSVVIFKGGNPLAIFTSQDTGEGDVGAEAEAPPSPEEPTPEPESEPMPMETEVTPTEVEESSDILALSTPSTVPSFAPPAPAKASAPSGATGSSVKMAAAPRPVGRAGAKRTGKSTLFGFSEKMGGELEGTMYDLKLKADGKKPSGISEQTFAEAVKKIVRNRFRPASLADFYRVDKKFFATMFYIPLQEAGEAPKTFGVQGKVKPNNFIIHYTGSFAAPEDGTYRFVGLGDESIIVMVDGSVKLEGNWVPFLSYAERNDRPGDSVLEFFPTIKQNESWARLREGEWISLKAGQPRRLDVLLVEQGDPNAPGGGNFAFILLIEKQGVKYETKKKGNQTFTVLPPFLLEEPDSGMQKIIRENKDKLEVDLKNALVFGTAAPAPAGSPEPEPAGSPSAAAAPPSTPPQAAFAAGGRTDTASASGYGGEWKEGAGAADGWEGWVLRANGNPDKKSYAGFYLAKQEEKSGSASVATEGRSFAIFADGEGFQEAAAFRGFAKPLEANQSFSVDFVTPVPKSNAGTTGSIGLTLRNGKKADAPADYNAGARFELTAIEGQANYQIFDGSQPSDSGLAVTPAGFRVEFTLKTPDTYDLKLYPLSGGSPVELKDRKLGGSAGAPLESFSIFNRDSEQNAFFNRLRLNP